MQPEALLRAVQMLSADVGNMTTNLALTKGQLDHARELVKLVAVQTWVHPQPGEDQPVEPFVRVPIGQYQAVLHLLDALS